MNVSWILRGLDEVSLGSSFAVLWLGFGRDSNLVDNNKDKDESTLLMDWKKKIQIITVHGILKIESPIICGDKDVFMEIKKTVKSNVSFRYTSNI